MGAPLIELDEKVLRGLAEIGATMPEIASVLGVSETTLYERFLGIIEKGRADFKMSLRRRQWELANHGNPAMLIWLGKQLLGQKDKTESEHTDKTEVALTVKVIFDGNWLRSRDPLTDSITPSTGDPAIAGPTQDSGVRKALGQDVPGPGGDGSGSRPDGE